MLFSDYSKSYLEILLQKNIYYNRFFNLSLRYFVFYVEFLLICSLAVR